MVANLGAPSGRNCFSRLVNQHSRVVLAMLIFNNTVNLFCIQTYEHLKKSPWENKKHSYSQRKQMFSRLVHSSFVRIYSMSYEILLFTVQAVVHPPLPFLTTVVLKDVSCPQSLGYSP